jgi:hypothetical protein
MKAETLTAIAAGGSAIIAIAAAAIAKRSADRSAAAEERSARAAVRSASAAEQSARTSEKALAIERERRGDEQRDRELAAVPQLTAGELDGSVWVALQRPTGRFLSGVIKNGGPGAARITNAAMVVRPFGTEEGEWKREQAVLSPGSLLLMDFRWRAYPEDLDLTILVHYVAPSGAGYEAAFSLHSVGAGQSGDPMWRSTGPRVRPLG